MYQNILYDACILCRMNKDTFCDVVEAESIARTLYTSAQEFTVINHGYDNIVVLVDKKYALRFARNDSARLRSKFEKYLLNYLEQNSSVNSPRVIREQREPYCLVVTFLFGTHLSPSNVRKFTLPQQKMLRVSFIRYKKQCRPRV